MVNKTNPKSPDPQSQWHSRIKGKIVENMPAYRGESSRSWLNVSSYKALKIIFMLCLHLLNLPRIHKIRCVKMFAFHHYSWFALSRKLQFVNSFSFDFSAVTEVNGVTSSCCLTSINSVVPVFLILCSLEYRIFCLWHRCVLTIFSYCRTSTTHYKCSSSSIMSSLT